MKHDRSTQAAEHCTPATQRHRRKDTSFTTGVERVVGLHTLFGLVELPYLPSLICPYGGKLVNLMVPAVAYEEVHAHARRLPSIQLSARAVCDLELLATGAFSPLDRFMGQADYQQVLDTMRLSSGYLFPIPITLPVDPAPGIRLDQQVALRDATDDTLLAVMTIEDIYTWDAPEMAQKVLRSTDLQHPLVAEMRHWGRLNISGPLQVLQLPQHYDFRALRLTPAQTRVRLEATGYENVVAFQTRNLLHRVHEELTKRATEEVDGALLFHPVVGVTKPGDVDHFTRVRAYKALTARYYDAPRVVLALLPLAMRLAGPREALWHALIRRNYGANHFIVGRDHAGPGVDSTGQPFYGPYDAQELLGQYSHELGVSMVPFRELVYLPDEDRYEEESNIVAQTRTAAVSGTQVCKEYLSRGHKVPEWCARPEVADILAEAYPPRHRQGLCLWFTGLSGAGKSTTVGVLTALLQECGRQVTVLDNDVVRSHLSTGLDACREDRETTLQHISVLATEIVRHGGCVIYAAASPYRATRDHVRRMLDPGQFLEVGIATPLDEICDEICEAREVKGVYTKGRPGELNGCPGIDGLYEPPDHPEISLTTVTQTPEENAHLILQELVGRGFVHMLSANSMVLGTDHLS